jgi:hypothetical protein
MVCGITRLLLGAQRGQGGLYGGRADDSICCLPGGVSIKHIFVALEYCLIIPNEGVEHQSPLGDLLVIDEEDKLPDRTVDGAALVGQDSLTLLVIKPASDSCQSGMGVVTATPTSQVRNQDDGALLPSWTI